MDQPDQPLPPGDLVPLFSAATASEAVLVKGLLEAHGIPVLMKGEAEGPYRLGPADLWVPAGLEVQARAILEDARSTTPEPDPPAN